MTKVQEVVDLVNRSNFIPREEHEKLKDTLMKRVIVLEAEKKLFRDQYVLLLVKIEELELVVDRRGVCR